MISLRHELEAEIEQAKSHRAASRLDGQGGLYSDETLRRAVVFVRRHIEWLWQSCGVRASIPTIGPGPDESADLYWRQPSWRLLVNIPASAGVAITYYGSDSSSKKIKGSVDNSEEIS